MRSKSQLTEEEALAKFESKWWEVEGVGAKEIVDFQRYQKRLCCPFDVLHEATENVLGRSVWSHEFAWPERLQAEYEGKRAAPTMEEIIEPIADKAVIVFVDK